MPKVKLIARVFLQAGSTPTDTRTYEGQAGDVIEAPDDIAGVIVSMGLGVVEEPPAIPAPPPDEPRARKR